MRANKLQLPKLPSARSAIKLIASEQFKKIREIDRLQHEWAEMQQIKMALILMEGEEHGKKRGGKGR